MLGLGNSAGNRLRESLNYLRGDISVGDGAQQSRNGALKWILGDI